MPGITHAPPRPTKSGPIRQSTAAVVTAVGVGIMWTAATSAAASIDTTIPGPTMTPARAGALVVVVAVLAGLTAWARIAHANREWCRAIEDQRIYEAVARPVRMDLRGRARGMKVHGRAGNVPNDVTLRVQSPAEAALPKTMDQLRTAFAHAVDAPDYAVAVEPGPRGVRIRVAEPLDPDHALARAAAPTATKAAAHPVAHVEPERPVPAIAPTPRIAARIDGAMRGLIGTDVKTEVVSTHASGGPEEVWVDYPPELTSKIPGLLPQILDTIGNVVAPERTSWALEHQSTEGLIKLRDRIDPLAVLVDLPPLEDAPDLEKGAVAGVMESGGEWRIPLMGGAHVLIAGATGAGKGSVLWNILRALAPMIADGRARLWVIDPKSGMEFGKIRTACEAFAITPTEQLVLLRRFKEVMDEKGARIAAAGLRKIPTPVTPAMPIDLLLVDELANLGDDKQIQELIKAVLQLGRASGATVVGALQDPKVDAFKYRDSFTLGVGLRLRKANQVNMALGDGARANGALADRIPQSLPGVAYVVTGESDEFDRVRCAFVSDDQTHEVAAMIGVDIAAYEEALIPLTAPPVGAPVAKANQPTLPSGTAPARGETVRITTLDPSLDRPVVAFFDGDPEPVNITGWVYSDEPDLIQVHYRYDGGPEAVTDTPTDETVTLLLAT